MKLILSVAALLALASEGYCFNPFRPVHSFVPGGIGVAKNVTSLGLHVASDALDKATGFGTAAISAGYDLGAKAIEGGSQIAEQVVDVAEDVAAEFGFKKPPPQQDTVKGFVNDRGNLAKKGMGLVSGFGEIALFKVNEVGQTIIGKLSLGSNKVYDCALEVTDTFLKGNSKSRPHCKLSPASTTSEPVTEAKEIVTEAAETVSEPLASF